MAQQILATDSLGGFSIVTRLSKEVRDAVIPMMKFRQFVDFKEAFGKGAGESVTFGRTTRIATAGGTIAETSTIPRSNIVFDRGTLTVNEYGNAIGKTQKLTNLNMFDVNNKLHRALRDDMALTLDSAVGDQFKDTLARYTAITSTSGTLGTAGTFLGTSTFGLNKYHIGIMTDQLAIWNVPKIAGNYVCIASIRAIRDLKNDTTVGGWVDAARYAGSKRLFTGEVGVYDGVRFIEETNVLSNTIGSTSIEGEAMMFGQDTVTEGVAIPEQIRQDTPRDFGRDLATAWYTIQGHKITWASTTDSDTVDADAGVVPRIIYMGSL